MAGGEDGAGDEGAGGDEGGNGDEGVSGTDKGIDMLGCSALNRSFRTVLSEC